MALLANRDRWTLAIQLGGEGELAHGLVFISSSSDTLAERKSAFSVIDRLQADLGIVSTPESLAYGYERDDDVGAYAVPIQEQILRASHESVDFVVCVIGERVGLPLSRLQRNYPEIEAVVQRLRPDFCMPGDTTIPAATPLTGTLFEIFDALAANKDILFFCKGPEEHIFNFNTLDLAERRFGGGAYERAFQDRVRQTFSRGLTDAESVFLNSQRLGVKRLYDEVKNFTKICFGTAAEFEQKLERELRKRFSKGRQDVTAEAFRGLRSFTLADRNAFFGRAEEVGEALGIVDRAFRSSASSPILLIHGPSGVGKSSFLNAGIGGALVKLENEGGGPAWATAGETWRPVAVTPRTLTEAEMPALTGEASKFALVWQLCQLLERVANFEGVMDKLSGVLLREPTRERVFEAVVQSASGVRPFFLFDQAEDLLAKAPSADWQEVFILLASLCRDRKSAAAFCIADTKATQKVSEGWLERWCRGELAKLLGPTESYPLQHLGVDSLVDVMTQTFVRAGVEVPAETRAHFRRALKQFEANQLAEGIAVHDALPLISVSLQLSENRRRARMLRLKTRAVPRDTTRNAQPEARSQDAASDLLEPGNALKPGDLAPLDEAIERLAEDAFRVFVEQDLGLPWVTAQSGDFNTSGHAEAERILQGLLRWLVSIQGHTAGGAPGQNAVELWTLVARPLEEKYIASRIGSEGEKLARRLLEARLLKRELQTEIRVSHVALFASWSRASAWLKQEYNNLKAYQNLCGYRDNGGGDPNAGQLLDWGRLYAAWGVDGPWRPHSRGSGEEAGPDRAWLQRNLLKVAHAASTATAASSALWVALLAHDDAMASALVFHYSEKPALAPALGKARAAADDWRQAPPIVFAAANQLPLTLGKLIDAAVDPLATNRLRQSVLHVLAERGDRKSLEQLRGVLANRPLDVKSRTQKTRLSLAAMNGWTPFHSAALGRAPEVVPVLGEISDILKAIPPGQIELTSSSYSGATPLHIAASQPDTVAVSLVRELLIQIDHREVRDADGALPIHRAVAANNPRACEELLFPKISNRKALRSQMAARTAGSAEAPLGHTPLTLAARRNASAAARALFEADVIKNIGWKGGCEALRVAAGYGAVEIVVMILDRARSRSIEELLNDKDQRGRSALHLAAQYRHVGVLQSLLAQPRAKALINATDLKQQTALHWAAAYHDVSASDAIKNSINCLLDAGADAGLRNDLGLTAFEVALSAGTIAACEALLTRAQAVFSPERILPQALRFKDEAFALSVISSCSVEQLGTVIDERSLLHHAAYQGATRVLSALVERRGNLVHAKDRYGHTPLHSAALGDQPEAIKLLVAAGADITVQQSSDRTALHLAAYDSKHSAVAALLGSAGDRRSSLLEIPDRYGKTAFHVACEAGDPHLVRLLLEQGADPSKRSASGQRGPAHLAAHNGCLAVLETLLALRPDIVRGQPTEGAGGLLHAAAAGGKAYVIDWLFSVDAASSEAALSEPNERGWTPMGLSVARWSKEHNRALAEGSASVAVNDLDRAETDPLLSSDEEGSDVEAPAELSAWRTMRSLEARMAGRAANRRVPDPGVLYAAVRSREPAMVRRFIDRGYIDVVAAGEQASPLHAAIELGELESFVMLLNVASSEDLVVTNRFERTPLHLACRLGLVEQVRALVDKGAPLAPLDAFEATPADLALKHGHPEVAAALEALAPKGTQLFGPRSHEHRIAQLIKDNDLRALETYLRSEAGAPWALTAAVAAAQDRNAAALKMIRETLGVDMTASVESGLSPLLAGLRAGYGEIIEGVGAEALTHAAQVSHAKGVTLLHAAAQSGLLAACRTLVEQANASPLAVDHHGRTAMHYAAAVLREDVVTYLGSCPDARSLANVADGYGQTPLHKVGAWVSPRVPYERFEATINALIALGANPLAADKRGRTAADLAGASEGKQPIAELLAQLEKSASAKPVASLSEHEVEPWLRRSARVGPARRPSAWAARIVAVLILATISALVAWGVSSSR